ncbi:MAG TPA: hypothetical protein VMF53_14710 [Alphaproteobacteria bacterium]|nr:hypothetical protein [Alphaproteobacteria bacterium]
MSIIYVARSSKFSKWGSDVGLSKNLYKLGVTDEPVKDLVARGWAGETDWQLVKKQDVDGIGEEEAVARLALKDKMVDPNYYPKLKGARGLFKIPIEHVENSIVVARAMANNEVLDPGKLKPADFASYMIENALK